MSELKFDPTQRARGTVIAELQRRAGTAESEVERLRLALEQSQPSDDELMAAYNESRNAFYNEFAPALESARLRLDGHLAGLRAVASLTEAQAR